MSVYIYMNVCACTYMCTQVHIYMNNIKNGRVTIQKQKRNLQKESGTGKKATENEYGQSI